MLLFDVGHFKEFALEVGEGQLVLVLAQDGGGVVGLALPVRERLESAAIVA